MDSIAVPIPTRLVSCLPGRVRLRVHPRHRQSHRLPAAVHSLQAHPQVHRVQANAKTGSLLIHHDRQEGTLEGILATLEDLGLIAVTLVAGEIPSGPSAVAVQLAGAIADLNQRVKEAAGGTVDLRLLFPLALALLSLRQLKVRGLQLDTVPWYVLAWYAFDSFIKLHERDAWAAGRKAPSAK